jgi:two-component system sensor histidine kinase/response regulator
MFMTEMQQTAQTTLCASILRLVGDNHEVLRELIALFLEDCPRYMADIRDSIRQGNAAGLRSAAHLLRGSAGNFGISPAYQAAARLESMGRAGNLDEAEVNYATLEEEIRRLQTALAAIVAAAGA